VTEDETGRAELLRDADRRAAWVLLIGGVPQSHVDLDDPGYLDFEYVRRLGHLVDLAAPAGQPLRVLHLGAGALTLARYVAATRPASAQVAVEVDESLWRLIRLKLPPRRGRIRMHIGDARAVLERLPAGSFDVIIADVFAGGRTPAHLTSVEFAGAARRALDESGVFAVNVADGGSLRHARAQVATVRAVFPHACLIADPAVLRGRRFGNLVLAGGTRELPVDALTRRAASDPMPGRLVHGHDLVRFTGGAKPVTDSTATPSPAPPPGAFAFLPLTGLQGPDGGQHAPADEGQVGIRGQVRRHGVDQVAEGAQPHPGAYRRRCRRRHVDLAVQLHDADRAEDPDVRHPGQVARRGQPGVEPGGQPGHAGLPPARVPLGVEQHGQRRECQRAGQRVAHEGGPVGEHGNRARTDP
jgi:predicted O-methyltransferase YrrM